MAGKGVYTPKLGTGTGTKHFLQVPLDQYLFGDIASMHTTYLYVVRVCTHQWIGNIEHSRSVRLSFLSFSCARNDLNLLLSPLPVTPQLATQRW